MRVTQWQDAAFFKHNESYTEELSKAEYKTVTNENKRGKIQTETSWV
jgi:hypothetical protein